MHILYWHWLAFGMILIILEMVIASFTIFWFGLGACLVGGLLLLAPNLDISVQILLWAIFSAFFTFLWFRVLRPRMTDQSKSGMAREAVLGLSGMVVKIPQEGHRGVVRFSTPVLGSDEWQFICEQNVVVGDRVYIIETSGNTLVVEKRT